MASCKSFRHSVVVIAACALFVGGCATEQTSLVGTLPPPNFAGPAAVAPTLPPQAPIVAKAPVAPPVRPQPKIAMAGIPKEWVPHVQPRSWQAIVIHHSATAVGGAARFDREHKEKGWDELGYDFVIGNGTDTADGQIEVGSRWIKQKVGAHAKTPDNWYNEHGIGICLVGNFDNGRPSAAQMRSVGKLVAFMMRTYHIPADRIVGHGDTKQTACPGRYLSLGDVKRVATQILATSGVAVGAPQTAGSRELLVDFKER